MARDIGNAYYWSFSIYIVVIVVFTLETGNSFGSGPGTLVNVDHPTTFLDVQFE